MTKGEWISLIKHNLSGGDCPDDLRGVYHPKDLALYFEMAYDDFILDQQDRYGKIKDWKIDVMTEPFCLTVECDEKRSLKYVIINKATPKLRNNAQVVSVSPVKGEDSSFSPRSNSANWAYSQLGTTSMTGETVYWMEGNKLFFENLLDTYKELLVKLVVSISEMDEDAEVPVQAGQNLIIFQSIYRFLREMPPEDLVNDSNPTK